MFGDCSQTECLQSCCQADVTCTRLPPSARSSGAATLAGVQPVLPPPACPRSPPREGAAAPPSGPPALYPCLRDRSELRSRAAAFAAAKAGTPLPGLCHQDPGEVRALGLRPLVLMAPVGDGSPIHRDLLPVWI